ncbi:hypothetical protein SCLCIDRAFT_1218934 [Scleroderma citrinum Foug A]|uniref:Uncharacterized protein n=1 Tax=Scleroderma citrinum Foug A TaxID=1036808 RepID=A0A0C3DPQ2_9AGAM|nr:hypothetical protein SCLCIDRAFT_1218934 [Scleroderma citrinum Foug A]
MMVLLPLRCRRAHPFRVMKVDRLAIPPSVLFGLWFTSSSASSLGSSTNLQLHFLAEEPCY